MCGDETLDHDWVFLYFPNIKEEEYDVIERLEDFIVDDGEGNCEVGIAIIEKHQCSHKGCEEMCVLRNASGVFKCDEHWDEDDDKDHLLNECEGCGERGRADDGFKHDPTLFGWWCPEHLPKCFTCQSEEVVEHPEADKWYCEAHKMREEPPGSGHFHSGH